MAIRDHAPQARDLSIQGAVQIRLGLAHVGLDVGHLLIDGGQGVELAQEALQAGDPLVDGVVAGLGLGLGVGHVPAEGGDVLHHALQAVVQVGELRGDGDGGGGLVGGRVGGGGVGAGAGVVYGIVSLGVLVWV